MPDQIAGIVSVEFGAAVSLLVAALCLLWTVVSGLISAMSAALLRRAKFYLEFTDRYNTSDMHEAMQELIAYHYLRADFAKHYSNEFASRTPEGIRLDRLRRTINRYYVNVADMAANGLLDRKNGLNGHEFSRPKRLLARAATATILKLHCDLMRLRTQAMCASAIGCHLMSKCRFRSMQQASNLQVKAIRTDPSLERKLQSADKR